MQRAPSDAATADPRFGRFCVSGAWAADLLIGTTRLTMPLRVATESIGDDLLVRYAVAQDPAIEETVLLPGAAAVIGPAFRRLVAGYAVRLTSDAEAA